MTIKTILLVVFINMLLPLYSTAQNVLPATNPDWKALDNGKILITYDLPYNTDMLNVTVQMLSNQDSSFSVGVKTATGSIGNGKFSGPGQTIIWDYKKDGLPVGDYSVKVTTDIISSANAATADSNIFDTLIPEMVYVEGGTFKMGDSAFEESPVHNVKVSSFNIAKYPITVEQYRNFCNATDHLMPDAPSWGWNDKSPIVNISYNDAVAYCNWLSVKQNGKFRLPTEAEYEFAARGGTKSLGYIYSGGNDMDKVGWDIDKSVGQTNSVGQKRPNELGLYDMSGNVCEWCLDWYGNSYYRMSPTLNPTGPETGVYRVLRGGGWNSVAIGCRVSYRYHGTPQYHSDNFGFRVVSPD